MIWTIAAIIGAAALFGFAVLVGKCIHFGTGEMEYPDVEKEEDE